MEAKMIDSASLTVTGMKCSGCESKVATKLMSMEGVESANASSIDKEVKVEFDADKTSLKAIAEAISDLGYTVVEDN
jgi:copper chaperone